MKAFNDLKVRLKQAEEIMLSARDLLLEAYSPTPGSCGEFEAARLSVSSKTSFKDLVTAYDKKVEEYLKGSLRQVFSGEHIVGEETLSGMRQSPESVCKNLEAFWLIDPIDGTVNFSRSYPFFSSTMAFVVKTPQGFFEPLVGVTYDPVRDELFSAALNEGAWLNRVKLKTSAVKEPKQALLVTGFASDSANVGADAAYEIFKELTRSTLGVRRDGSAGLDLAYVACGRLDAYWEWGLAPWDIAAGTLLVAEAGGRVSDHGGQALKLFEGEILASNNELHGWLMEKIKEKRK